MVNTLPMALDDAYERAVEKVDAMVPRSMPEPGLDVQRGVDDGIRREPQNYRLVLDESAVSALDRELEVQIENQITRFFADAVRSEVRDISRSLPERYGGVPLDTVTFDRSLTGDGAVLAHAFPATLRIGPAALGSIDPAGQEVERPLSTLLTSEVAHAALNADLYGHPGFVREEPYRMDGLDLLHDTGAVREVYGEAREEFREAHDLPDDRAMPGLGILRRRGAATDLDRGTVAVDRDLLPMLDARRTRDEFGHWLKAFHDDGLERALRDRAPAIADRYAAFDPEVRVDEAYFDVLDDGVGKHNHDRHRIRIDTSKIPLFDPFQQRFLEAGARYIGDHELTHDLDFTNSAATRAFWDDRASYDGKYTEDYRNAPVEVITAYEEFRSGGRRGAEAVDVVDAPWDVPHFLRKLPAVRAEAHPDDLEYDPIDMSDPYEFGLFTALNLQRGFEAADVDDPVRRTRRELYTRDTSLESMKRLLSRGFARRGIPDYAGIVSGVEHLAEGMDAPMPDALAGLGEMVAGELSEAETGEEALGPVYRGKAVLSVYRHRVEPDWQDAPPALKRLDGAVSDALRDYA